jgi:hypothetical protein
MDRKRLRDPVLHARKMWQKKREEEKHALTTEGRKKNKTEAFHSFFFRPLYHS